MNSQYKPSSELDNVPLASAEEERVRAAAWMDTAAFHLSNEEYWKNRAEQAEAMLNAQSGQLLPTNEVVMSIPVSGTFKAIKDVLEKFDERLVPLYMKVEPNCLLHEHPDAVFINCSMDANKNFKVLGLTHKRGKDAISK